MVYIESALEFGTARSGLHVSFNLIQFIVVLSSIKLSRNGTYKNERDIIKTCQFELLFLL